MPWSPDKIPKWLQRTPEQQAADDRLQQRLRQTYGPGLRLTPTERHLQRAVAVERSAVAQLNHLATDENADPKHIQGAAAQLADARAAQGHYAEAAAIHPDPQHAARFLAIHDAIERPDDDTCDCQPETVRTPDGKQVTIQNENIDEMIFSRKHGNRLVSLIQCKCGNLNAKPAPPALQRRLGGLRTKEG